VNYISFSAHTDYKQTSGFIRELLYICGLVLVHFNLGRKKFREQLFEHFKVQNSQHGGRPRDGGGGPHVGPGGRVHREPRLAGVQNVWKGKNR
jgi:hypothetical protein